MEPKTHFFIVFLVFFVSPAVIADHGSSYNNPSSIVFTTLGRSSYCFDIYSLPLGASSLISSSNELRLTDGNSVNFNGFFPSASSVDLLFPPPDDSIAAPYAPLHLIYVTERNGSSRIFLDSLYHHRTGSRSILEAEGDFTRFQVPLVGLEQSDGRVPMKDKPTLVGEHLIYVSTHENSGVPRTSWAAVYSTHLKTGLTRRLTPYGVADFSPAVSPSGIWTAVASEGKRGWEGEVQELHTDIYVFLTRDGSQRVKVVEHGGWPSWADDSTFYFHRRCEDGWWSVFRAVLPKSGGLSADSVVIQRVTPPGLHAFTPAASVADGSFIAVATRRPGSDFRHIELYDVLSGRFTPLTQHISPNAHHLNPFISADSIRIGYHRCRGSDIGGTKNLLLENLENPFAEEVSLFRLDGSFPSFSPGGDRIAFVDFTGVFVVNSDGSGYREVLSQPAFTTAWDWKRKGVVYTSTGPTFASESTEVDIISINVDDENLSFKKLTENGENNAFPSPSPDGKWVVFRSGRSGHKNLYIMDALEGESGGLYQLTEGPWSDTMANWSPDGEWIAFASDRENPGSGSFELFMVHPNGTGLRKLIQRGSGGRTNHPWFSPDGKYIVFTSDYAGVSAEPISNPHHYQPYGEIFVIKSDGSGIRRLTHNSYEDGTPTWGPKFLRFGDVEWPNRGTQCDFEDCHWLNIRSPRIVKYGDDHTSSSFPSKDDKLQCPH
ncbi:OLC1v1016346C1 [Oldenlandia corymbosa var. corymbosa]|uniref:OLC1v1016346C1 n=1 Tax=Oldenlandia corymbosa var. corymbosa TaxID=529605 RepID=A0AAV1E656_OLDCO|nr:OLC1v1016346C1 [Oldenlandia corymbosa var. corymbosa]